MVRFVRLLLALAVLATSANVVYQEHAAAGTSIARETPLLATTDPGAPVVSMLPAGAEVTLTGPPQGSLYPVQVTGLVGWVDGAALAVVKEAPPSEAAPLPAAAPAAAPEPDSPQPAEIGSPTDVETADALGSDGEVTTSAGTHTPEVAPTAGDALAQDASGSAVATSTGTPAPTTAEPTPAGPAASPMPDAASGIDPEPAATTPTPPVTEARTPAGTPAGDETVLPAEPAPTDSSSTTLDAATREGTPPPPAPATEPSASTATATATPTATPEPTPRPERRTGPATAKWDAPLREWPGEQAPLVFTIPAGATVEQLGDVSDGYVYATYMWMWGWIAIEALGPPAPSAEEAVPGDADVADVRARRPGTGVARTTVDLSLRAGPSASERAIALVPAGSEVEQTGVMENGFQRVVWDGQIGWIASDYLELPATPTPATANGRPNGKPEYSEQEIIKIIYAAADHYGQDRQDMLRVARCESNLDPYAVHPSGSYGLFQFIRSTWESTPYGDKDVFDPRANAMAAGWMWAEGRRSEWVCK